MPSPSTTDLPRPKYWDEFEDICADVLKRFWKDPHVERVGRLGQKQHGVDIYGQPDYLDGSSSGRHGGAQCKKTDVLDLATVEAELKNAQGFRPALSEFLLMTTAPKDSQVQRHIRTGTWPFRVRVMFWDDICSQLSEHSDLLQKHFPDWMKKTTTERHVLNQILSSDPEDFKYDDSTGEFFHKSDVMLRIVFERGEQSERDFTEPWVAKFADPHATRQPVYIYYGDTRVHQVNCVYVDGGRQVIPYPRSPTDLTLTRFQYHIGRILNHPILGYDFDFALKRTGITVNDKDA